MTIRGVVLVCALLTGGGYSVASTPSHETSVSVRGWGESRYVRVDTEVDHGPVELPPAPLSALREATDGRITLRLMRSDAEAARAASSAMIVPDISPEAARAKGLFWGPMQWAVREMERAFGRPLPPLVIELILVPEGFRLRHRVRLPMNEQMLLRLAIGAHQPMAEAAEFDVLWVAQTGAVHEVVHILRSKRSGFGFEQANVVSEEALAYTLQTCATLIGGEFDQALVASAAPLSRSQAAQWHALPSRELFSRYAETIGVAARALQPTHRGGLLAGMSLWELLGDERRISSEASRERVETYCAGMPDYRGDWLAARPCAGDKRLAGVCAVHALP